MSDNTVLLELLREINRESEAKDVMRACKIAASTIEALQAEVERLKSTLLPTELTPTIKSVLGMMCFNISHYAHVYQAAGFNIPKKAEEEQAFCLHRWLGFALEHGDKWTDIANQELKDLREKIAKEQNHD